MAPSKPLPIPEEFQDVDDYIESLLQFVSSSTLFQTLCGGIHILDSFIQQPSHYDSIFPTDWRAWLAGCETMELLDVLMRDDLDSLDPQPPPSLVKYIKDVRKHTLIRSFASRPLRQKTLARHVRVGMIPKKIHEVTNFADYVVNLAEDIEEATGQPITHFVDFGSGQNYLGRVLASPPYHKHIIAVESKELNINGAKEMDVHAKLAAREKVVRNKKLYREQMRAMNPAGGLRAEPQREEEQPGNPPTAKIADLRPIKQLATIYNPGEREGSIQYVEDIVGDGDLSKVVQQINRTSRESHDPPPSTKTTSQSSPGSQSAKLDQIEAIGDGLYSKMIEHDHVPHNGDQCLMAISVHSCGNLSHHGIRSLLLNPSVRAIAIVGCCYNLLTERLGPPTYKPALLRPNLQRVNARVARESTACDPHGFPMSERLVRYNGGGIHFNITARMMAVQAPQNWSEEESASFFTRHFFRALLQRLFYDRGLVSQTGEASLGNSHGSISDQGTDPVIIGSLRKGCYGTFAAYVRGAIAKLALDPERGSRFVQKVGCMTDEEIERYAESYSKRKKELSDMWSLMSFSAGVVESVIAVDRWQYLREHSDVVTDCWVEAVFDYKQSPRNLAVVGIKRLS